VDGWAVPLPVIAEQRARGWPDLHPEDFCHRCGHRNLSWYVDSALWVEAWAQAEPGIQSVLCPQCFAELWEKVGTAPLGVGVDGSGWRRLGWMKGPRMQEAHDQWCTVVFSDASSAPVHRSANCLDHGG